MSVTDSEPEMTFKDNKYWIHFAKEICFVLFLREKCFEIFVGHTTLGLQINKYKIQNFVFESMNKSFQQFH